MPRFARSCPSHAIARRVGLLAALVVWLTGAAPVSAQSDAYDPSWYDPNAPHLRIAVVEDGVYAVPRADLEAQGLPASADPSTFQLFENGREIPVEYRDASDELIFVGRRNRGTDEREWAYDRPESQSSDFRSLYSDTTYYFLRWGQTAGRRYAAQSPGSGGTSTASLRDTVHAEQDTYYYFGRTSENGSPLYTRSEGYYWRRFGHTDTETLTFEHTLPVGRRTASGTLDLAVQVDVETSSCHRVRLSAELNQSGGGVAFESLDTVEWIGTTPRTLRASVAQDRVPTSGLRVRVESFNDGFSSPSCSPGDPNFVLLDFIEAAYTRQLTPRDGAQRFVAPSATSYRFELAGYGSGADVSVYNPTDARRFALTASGGTARFTDTPSTAPAPYWAVAPGGYRSPAAILPDASSNWSVPSAHGADYLILTTAALLPSARDLADYRRSQDGYAVEIALVQDVFDEFDGGRPTPLAIRRFVRATQSWSPAPRFLTIYGDAQYPIYTGDIDERRPPWNVPSFGYSPSDAWFAMQRDGASDWTEFLAVGRIPVRSNAQGELFLEKLRTYEAAPLDRWQKRMLLLAGGTSASEQADLQNYSNRWGRIAADTLAPVDASETPVPVNTGMDTLRYYKNINDALDASFQDSLTVDLQRGVGWLNYFGHSAAQTWEIVTDPPSEFGNAGRLPMVVSLGCRTGSFAGGRFEVKSAPSLGEQLVVGSVTEDGTPRSGTLNGGIAHWGTSALGNLRPSARLNEELVERVFVDTLRVIGPAIQDAKAEIAAEFGYSGLYVRHLLQYGLIGDPATRLALPTAPDLRIGPEAIRVDPFAPTPSDDVTVTVDVQNYGLYPSDSVDVAFSWTQPDGRRIERSARLERFALQSSPTFDVPINGGALGTNTLSASTDDRNEYAEVNETNNAASRQQFVLNTGLELVAPTPYGVVDSAQPTLRVNVIRQTEATPIDVVIELDTTATFDSPARQSTRLSVSGLTGDWQPSPLRDGQSYHWRARVDDDTANEAWKIGAFTVRTDASGATWLQRGNLFDVNGTTRLASQSGTWSFTDFRLNVQAFSDRSGAPTGPNGFNINSSQNYLNLAFGFGVLILDRTSGEVRAVESFPTYDLDDQYVDPAVGEQQEAIDNLIAFLDANARNGDHVFIRTRHFARQSGPALPESVKDAFRNLGSTPRATPYSQAIDTLTYEHLWTFYAQKGEPSSRVEQVSPPSEASTVRSVVYEKDLFFPHASGTTLTPPIGPARNWSRLAWDAVPQSPGGDVRIQVLAADSTVLIDDLTASTGTHSLDAVDASVHPRIHLRATLTDSTQRVPPQLREWSVDYTGVPDLAASTDGIASVPDTTLEGTTVDVSVPVTNIGPVATSGPVVVHYTLDRDNEQSPLGRDTLRALAPGESATSTFQVSTRDRVGTNTVTMSATSDDPVESVAYNNTVFRRYQVVRDQQPPTVTMLYEGREVPETFADNIVDERIPFVAVQPTFDIVVADENPFFLLDDTSTVKVFVKDDLPRRDVTGASQYERVGFQENVLEFVPATDDNEARVLFRPDLSEPIDPTTLTSDDQRTYTIRVEAVDKSGNELAPYDGSVRVQDEQVIEDLYPYPNPMSTHTTFAFRIRGGNTRPDDFTLRIYTVSGRLVRTFDGTDANGGAGLRTTGWNVLDWNGRDEDGDRVATGVYLYRVRMDGENGTFEGDIEKIAVIR